MINLNETTHTYSDGQNEYASVTNVISTFSEYFDADQVSKFVADKRGVDQRELLDEWNAKREEASEWGNLVHSSISNFLKNGEMYEELASLYPWLLEFYKDYYSIESEILLYSEKYKIAGTADVLLKTTQHPRCIIDVHDVKTNLSKGIQFKSPYKKHMHYPLKHLSDCNYNSYALQLSSYAYLFQEMELAQTGQERKIGELAIIFINPDLTVQKWPVPYLKLEVEAMFNQFEKLRGVKLNW